MNFTATLVPRKAKNSELIVEKKSKDFVFTLRPLRSAEISRQRISYPRLISNVMSKHRWPPTFAL